MTKDISNNLRLTRRELLRITGVTGLALAAAGVAETFPGSLARVVHAQGSQDNTVEGFLAWAYAQRALAMTTNDPKLIQPIYDSSNPLLSAFEKERIGFMHDLGSRWRGKLLGYDANISLVDLSVSGSQAKVRIYETLRLLWIPIPRRISPTSLSLRQQYPEKFVSRTPRGPKGEIASSFGIRHEVIVEKQTGGWRLVQDSYEEPDLFGRSPDLKPNVWSSVWYGLLPNGNLKIGSADVTPQIPDLLRCTTYQYYYNTAVDYATDHCSSSSYNSAYCDYHDCGGDCANFVSQCLRAGNQVNGGNWYTFNGACGNCGTSSSNAGSDTWANNRYLRSWVIDSGRGVEKDDIDDLGTGDLVNYDWSGDGNYDHIAIVNDPINNCVCSHDPDRCDVDWELGGASSYGFTWVNVSYCA